MFDGARAGAGQAEVERVDAESFHQMEDFDFFSDRGIADGWGLQAVAESFVVEECGFDFGGRVPVVDQGGVHARQRQFYFRRGVLSRRVVMA